MSRRFVRRSLLSSFLVPIVLAFVPGVAAAQAAAPSDAERAITQASPGVVFIDTSVKIHARLIFQNSNTVSGLGHLDRTYAIDYATGSGFVVSSSGVIVTASHVVEPEEQSMHNYAANKLVLEGFGYSYPDRSSSPFDQYTLPVGYQNVLLQQCYKAIACEFTVTPIETVYSALDIAQGQLPKGTPARILTSTGFKNTDVAVLQVNGSNMPTVALADSASNLAAGDEVVALGFPGSSRDALQTGVTQPNKVFGRVSNIRPQGTSDLIEVDANIEPGMSGGPVIDESGRVVGLISFSLLQSSGESAAKYLRTIDDIKAALADAGVTPSRGTVDQAFSDAMDLFWGSHFTAAVPALERVLDLYPGHPLATQYLADAQAKAGTPQDVPVAEPSPASSGAGGGFPVWAIAAIAVGLVAVVGAVVLVSRRKKHARLAATMAPMEPPAPAIGMQAPPVQEAARVGFQPPQASTVQPVAVATPRTAPTPTPTQEEAPPAGNGRALFCSSCGGSLEAEAKFCPECGHHVSV